MQTFKGRLVTEQDTGEQTATEKSWTLDEIIQATRNGDTGMVSLRWYTIGGMRYMASALSIGGDSIGYGIPQEHAGAIVVMTRFRREVLANPFADHGDPMDLIGVLVVIDPIDIEYVSILHKVTTDDETQPSVQRPLFIAVFTDGGLITSVKTNSNLRSLILYMQNECDERFDPETDDARVFDADGDEVYVFPSPGELAEEGMGVYYCSHCQFSQRVHVDDPVRCETCEGTMERLDTLGVNA
ncbi:MAG: hypothetical protein ACYCYO_14190 [Bacilli bacterium]